MNGEDEITTAEVDGFRLRCTSSDEGQRLELDGELDIASVPMLDEAVTRLDGPAVVVDLSRLTFIDSTGIAALLRLRKDLSERGISVAVGGASARVRRIVELLGLTEVIFGAPGEG